MPRKKKPAPQDTSTPTADLPPDDREIITPETNPDRHRPSHKLNGTDHPLEQFKQELLEASSTGESWEKPGYVSRVRPDGPKKRAVGDEIVIYRGENIVLSRVVTNEDDDYYLSVKKPTGETVDGERMFLPPAKVDRLIAAGFNEISDRGNGSEWSAPTQRVNELGVDLNILAVVMDGKGERLAAGRGR